ncbi:MAG: 4-(cytidine 5'-diphospho)-2-C-methyl-D-erythritol kinase [Planctomycetota bacterium]
MNTATSNQFELHSPAKINLFLELLGRRPDGFHELVTIISPVSIYDTLRFRPVSGDGIELKVVTARQRTDEPDQQIPSGPENLIWKALQLFKEHCGISKGSTTPGAEVLITKRIPAAAGLGGASGNAAAALQAARRMWNPEVDDTTLNELAATLGSDVPVFLAGMTAMCTGRGESVRSIPCPAGIPLVIVQPPVGLSTAGVYSICKIPARVESENEILAEIQTGSLAGIASGMFNRLEEFASTMTDWIKRLREEFTGIGCIGHQMTGSGSAYFGVFSTEKQARIAAARLANRMPETTVFPCSTLQAISPG